MKALAQIRKSNIHFGKSEILELQMKGCKVFF